MKKVSTGLFTVLIISSALYCQRSKECNPAGLNNLRAHAHPQPTNRLQCQWVKSQSDLSNKSIQGMHRTFQQGIQIKYADYIKSREKN